MGKYLKQFTNHSDYEAFVGDGEFLKPNVSFCIEDIEVHFNPDIITYSTIDLGLPSGTLWADKNIGANKETDKGVYFQWASTIPIDEERKDRINEIMHSEQQPSQADFEYVIETSPYLNTSGVTKYTSGDGLTTLESEDDAAYVHMGSEWHIPSVAQANELSACTTPTLETVNDVKGIRLTSVFNGNSIFIPFTYSMVDGSNEYSDAEVLINERSQDQHMSYGFGVYKEYSDGETYSGASIRDDVIRYIPCSVRGVMDPPVAENLYNLIHSYEPFTNPTSFTITIDSASKGYINNWYSVNKKSSSHPSRVAYLNCTLYTNESGTIYIDCSNGLGSWTFRINSNYEIESYSYDNYSDVK